MQSYDVNKVCYIFWGKQFDENSILEDSSIGFISEVYLEYSDELHYPHNDYPLAPFSHDMWSNYCKVIAGKYGIKVGGVKELIPNFGNKSKYVLHYRNFHLHLSLEMQLTKVHRNLKLKESDWLKKYIDFNTDKRKDAAKTFERFFLTDN